MRRTSSSVSTTISEEFAQLASVAALAVPALGIVIVDPLMSLVDTACIGRTLSTQLAALAPNSSVFNLIFQVRHDSALIQSFIRTFRRIEVV
jgi:Na+-driven multidrug efflux pump